MTWLLAADDASEEELAELAAEWRAIAAVQRRIAYINALDLRRQSPLHGALIMSYNDSTVARTAGGNPLYTAH